MPLLPSSSALRKLHAWCGFYAALGLVFFAVTGFLLNHRGILNIPSMSSSESRIVRPLAEPFARSEDMSVWLSQEMAVPPERIYMTRFESKPAPWRDGEVQMPERWTAHADLQRHAIDAEYWAGERRIEVKRREPNLGLYLARFHMGIGVGTAWILFADSLALVLGLMGISGLFLWTRLHGGQRLAWGLAGAGVGLALLTAALGG